MLADRLCPPQIAAPLRVPAFQSHLAMGGVERPKQDIWRRQPPSILIAQAHKIAVLLLHRLCF